MKIRLLALALLVGTAFAQTKYQFPALSSNNVWSGQNNLPLGYAVSALPASPANGTTAIVTDSLSGCNSGGGTSLVLCRYNSSLAQWQAVSSPTDTSVTWTFVVVPYSTTVTYNLLLGNVFKVVLVGDVTSSSFTGLVQGKPVVLEVCQDGAGGHNYNWPANVTNAASVPTGANACVSELFVVDNNLIAQGIAASGGGGGVSLSTNNTWTGSNTFNGEVFLGATLHLATQAQTFTCVNDGTTGTTLNKLAKVSNGNCILAATSDTSGIVGIVHSGDGTTGSAEVSYGGEEVCTFDSGSGGPAVTLGHAVLISNLVGGDCQDAGASTPTTQTIGYVIGGSDPNWKVQIFLDNRGSGSVANQAFLNSAQTFTASQTLQASTDTPSLICKQSNTSNTANYCILAQDKSGTNRVWVDSSHVTHFGSGSGTITTDTLNATTGGAIHTDTFTVNTGGSVALNNASITGTGTTSLGATTLTSLSAPQVTALTTAGKGGFWGGVGAPLISNESLGALSSSANQVVAVQFTLPLQVTVRKVVTALGVAQGAACSFDAGIYDASGNRLLYAGSVAVFNCNSATVQSVTLGTPVTLNAGVYYYVFAASAVSTATYYRLALSHTNIVNILNQNSTRWATAANALTTTLPATLGTLTSESTFSNFPLVWFEP